MSGRGIAFTSLACGLAALLRQRSAEAIRLRPGFDDVRLVRQSIQQGLAQPRIGEHGGPFRER